MENIARKEWATDKLYFVSRPLFEYYIPLQHEQGSILIDLKNFLVPGGGHA